MASLNFDHFEREISAAESYLQWQPPLRESIRARGTENLRETEAFGEGSADITVDERILHFRDTTSLQGSNQNHNKYHEPAEREKLISRLLLEYNSRNSPNSYSEVDTSRTDDPNQNELFYASDIVPGVDIEEIDPIESDNRGNNQPSEPDQVVAHSTNSKKYLKSREDLQREADEKFKGTHLFKPTISRKSRSQSAPKTNIMDRLNDMRVRHERAMQERERLKSDYDQIRLAECSFKPNICKGTIAILKNKSEVESFSDCDSLDSGAVHIHRTPASERLHRDAKLKSELQSITAKALRADQDSLCTFQPSINPKSSKLTQSLDYLPIHERVGDLQRQRSQNMSALRRSVEESQVDLTFVPQIDTRSKQIASQRWNNLTHSFDDSTLTRLTEVEDLKLQLNGNVGARLQIEGQLSERRKQKLKHDYDDKLAESMKPVKPSKGTELLVKDNSNIGASFQQRQEQYRQQRQHRAMERKKEMDNIGSRWFKPQLADATSSIIEEKRPEIVNESVDERVERMYRIEKEEIERRRLEMEKKIRDQHSFTPSIDPVSRILGRASNLEELVENKRGKRAKDQARMKVEEKENRENSFQPKINNYVSNSPENYNAENFSPDGWAECPIDMLGYRSGETKKTINLREPEKMARDIRQAQFEKEERRRSELVLREIEELRECTFQPDVKTYFVPRAQKPVVVKGLGRHMELQQLTAKKKEELRQREIEAFRVKNASKFKRPEDGTTIVKPFQFSEPNCRPSKAALELEAELKQNLTFSPTVRRRSNSGII